MQVTLKIDTIALKTKRREMPWTAPSGNIYKLCLLDTNVLSEILKNKKKEAVGFLEKYRPDLTVPCMTVYNYIELRRKPELFEEYLRVFSIFSNFLLKPHRLIIQEEVNNQYHTNPISIQIRAFSPLGPTETHDLRDFVNQLFEIPDIAEIERNWREEEKVGIDSWLKRKSNFKVNRPAANAEDAERYVKRMLLDYLESDRLFSVKKKIESFDEISVENYPAIKTMLYSKYYRIFDPSWKPYPKEVTDTYIVAAAPYMDIVITEKYQAEILRKVQNRVPGLENLEIATLRDIRLS